MPADSAIRFHNSCSLYKGRLLKATMSAPPSTHLSFLEHDPLADITWNVLIPQNFDEADETKIGSDIYRAVEMRYNSLSKISPYSNTNVGRSVSLVFIY